jgi:hypothetical protein
LIAGAFLTGYTAIPAVICAALILAALALLSNVMIKIYNAIQPAQSIVRNASSFTSSYSRFFCINVRKSHLPETSNQRQEGPTANELGGHLPPRLHGVS